jgi:hypothetical protein
MRIGKTINDGYLFIYRGIRGCPLTSQKNVVRFSYLAIRAIKVMERGRNPGRFYGADRTCKTKKEFSASVENFRGEGCDGKGKEKSGGKTALFHPLELI